MEKPMNLIHCLSHQQLLAIITSWPPLFSHSGVSFSPLKTDSCTPSHSWADTKTWMVCLGRGRASRSPQKEDQNKCSSFLSFHRSLLTHGFSYFFPPLEEGSLMLVHPRLSAILSAAVTEGGLILSGDNRFTRTLDLLHPIPPPTLTINCCSL